MRIAEKGKKEKGLEKKIEKIILGIDPGTNVMGYGLIKVLDNKAEMVAMGVIDMRKMSDPYLRLGRIFERVTGIIDEYLPDEMAWRSRPPFTMTSPSTSMLP